MRILPVFFNERFCDFTGENVLQKLAEDISSSCLEEKLTIPEKKKVKRDEKVADPQSRLTGRESGHWISRTSETRD